MLVGTEQQATIHSGSNNIIIKRKMNMKKILFMSLLAGAFALTACNPVEEKVDNNKVYSSADDIVSGISFTQYADEA